MSNLTILQGDALDKLRELPGESIHCCVTSPPYWGLRDYSCEGQLGLEKTPEEYVAKMVERFREVRRVLRKDGTLWVNMGDSYASGDLSTIQRGDADGPNKHIGPQNRIKLQSGLKPKDLCGIPWRVAFALQADGWWLRSDIIWHKPNPMPESCTDRPTKSHEYLFLLTKSASYFYDAEAIKERGVYDGMPERETYDAKWDGSNGQQAFKVMNGTRNKRSVWTVATAPYPEAHFATYPPDLIKPCILSGTSAKGCCAKCGAPWERVVESEPNGGWSKKYEEESNSWQPRGGGIRGKRCDGADNPAHRQTTGWQPTCTIERLRYTETCNCKETIPCTVLDPFAGSGTTGQVALELGRKAILIELNPKYVELIKRRCDVTPGLALA